jgi:hypothetical protein
MKEYNNIYTKKIYAALVPIIGEIVAQGVLKSQAGKLGKDIESLTYDDSTKIINGLRSGLEIFIGYEAANQVAQRIEQIR